MSATIAAAATAAKVKTELARLTRLSPEALGGDVPLQGLVAESFMLIEIVIELQESFDVRIQQEDMRQVRTVGDLIALIVRKATPG